MPPESPDPTTDAAQVVRYARLYTDESGATHFADEAVELTPADFAPPAAPLNTAAFLPSDRTMWVGGPTDWAGSTPHPTPQRQLFCTVAGVYEVTASDGATRSFPAGSVLLLEDTWGAGHTTRITDEAVVLAVVLPDTDGTA